MDYARLKKHLKAWKDFNKKVGNPNAVGIFHETYLIKPNQFESFYGNMPKFGLAKALGINPVTPSSKTARQRLRNIR
ncbi:monooxygenase family protein [Bacillus sp. 2205SS5-2]|uniref:monooxygenase family protein n=1 Tax=Bacillus sp. 2205SS5-2 TaxID=3109031 RepID=UPI003005D930